MYGLTEIQCINNNAFDDRRAALPSSFVPVFVHAKKITDTPYCGTINNFLNMALNEPITHGEWEARQKAGK